MPFLPRNRYYLRVSSSSILPLYVYLDSQHVGWMSDQILRQVVADLRPKIARKLREEFDAHVGPGPTPAGVKKGTVDVHRGDTYQFAYFLRETERHSVLLKKRNFVLATESPVTTSSGPAEQKESSSSKKRRKARGGRTTGGNGDDYRPSDSESCDSDEPQVVEDSDPETAEVLDTSTTNRTRGATELPARVYVKVEDNEQNIPQAKPSNVSKEPSHVGDAGTSIEVDEDEEPKPKLALDLKYRAFSNFNRCLCVVVEPWPPQPSNSRAPSLAPSATSRAPSVTPTTSNFSTTHGQRAKTPLFLPDLDDEPTTPSHSRFRTLPPVPLFNSPSTSRDTDGMEDSEWDGSTSLMQFSQMLSATGRIGGVDVEEEDEFDGMALFADADEAKES